MNQKNCRHKHLFVTKKNIDEKKEHILQIASIHTELIKHSRKIIEKEQNEDIFKIQNNIYIPEKKIPSKNDCKTDDVFLISATCMEALPKNMVMFPKPIIQPHIEKIQNFGLKTKNTIDLQNLAKTDKKKIKKKKYAAKATSDDSKKKMDKMKNEIELRISLKKNKEFKKKLEEINDQTSNEKFYMSRVALTKEQCVFLETLDFLRNQSYIVNCKCSVEEMPSSFTTFLENFLRYFHVFVNFSNILLCPPVCSSISRKGAFWNPKPQYWYFQEVDTSEQYNIIKKGTNLHIEMNNLQFMFEHPCVDYKKKFKYFFIECNETRHVIACAFAKSPKSNYTIIYSHQNACDIGDNIVGYPNINDIALFLNCDILCYDYSGYGISGGKPSEDALKDNIVSLVDYVNKEMNVPLKKIILLGFSLGGAVSTIGATVRDVGGLITMAAPASISQVIKNLFHCGLKNKKFEEFEEFEEESSVTYFNTSQNIKYITCPYLGIHAYNDKLVPISHARIIYKNCLQPKFSFYVQNSNHNYLDTASEVWLRIYEFLYLDLIN